MYVCMYVYIYTYQEGVLLSRSHQLRSSKQGQQIRVNPVWGFLRGAFVLPLNRCVLKMPRHLNLLSSSIQRVASPRRTCPDLHTSGECSGVFLRVTSCITFSAFAGNFASLPFPPSRSLSVSHSPLGSQTRTSGIEATCNKGASIITYTILGGSLL